MKLIVAVKPSEVPYALRRQNDFFAVPAGEWLVPFQPIVPGMYADDETGLARSFYGFTDRHRCSVGRVIEVEDCNHRVHAAATTFASVFYGDREVNMAKKVAAIYQVMLMANQRPDIKAGHFVEYRDARLYARIA